MENENKNGIKCLGCQKILKANKSDIAKTMGCDVYCTACYNKRIKELKQE